MTGLLLLVVILGWVALIFWLSIFSAKKITLSIWRAPLALAIFAVVLPLPLVDEIVGKKQFEQLCKENSTIQVDRSTAAGRTVYLAEPSDVDVEGTWVRVVLKPRRFVDAATGETVVSYNELVAVGGWFIQMLGISEGNVPLIFKGTCVPENRPGSVGTFKSLGINYVEPLIKKGESK